MLKNIFVAVVSLSALTAYADSYGPLLTNGASNSYQILENAFNEAARAQVSDFPLLANVASSNPSMDCVESSGSDVVNSATGQAANLSPTWIGRVDITSGAQPSTGPLFPGIPGTLISVIPSACNPVTSSTLLDYSNAQWAALIGTPAPSDGVQVTMSTSASGDLQGVTVVASNPQTTITDTFRKNGSLLFFHEVLVTSDPPNAPSTGDAYGYCYPANEN